MNGNQWKLMDALNNTDRRRVYVQYMHFLVFERKADSITSNLSKT